MANLSYTPGPWHLGLSQSGRRFIYSSMGEQPLMPNVKLNKTGVTREMEANARLMAAAPELLEALKLAGNLFAANHAISQFDWGKSALRAEDIRELNEVPLAIRAAINKAEGRS